MSGHAWTESGVRIAQAVHADGRIVTTLRDREDRLHIVATEPGIGGSVWWDTVRANGRHRASSWSHLADRAVEVHAEMLESARAACGIGYRVHWRALQITR